MTKCNSGLRQSIVFWARYLLWPYSLRPCLLWPCPTNTYRGPTHYGHAYYGHGHYGHAYHDPTSYGSWRQVRHNGKPPEGDADAAEP